MKEFVQFVSEGLENQMYVQMSITDEVKDKGYQSNYR